MEKDGIMSATDLESATASLISSVDIISDIINGDATKEVVTPSGNISSIRKSLADNAYFQVPIPWSLGDNETNFNQLRTFTDGTVWWSPSASNINPIPMGATPVGDNNWYPFQDANLKKNIIEELTRFNIKGTFAAGFTYETVDDVGLDNSGSPWSYTGSLPFTVVAGTVPSEPTYKEVSFNNLQSLDGLEDSTDLNKVVFRNVTSTVAISDDAETGTYYVLTDRDYSKWVVVESSDTSGFYITGLSSGRKLRKIITNSETPLEYGDLSDTASNTLAIQNAIDNGLDVVIDRELTVNTITLTSNVTIRFAKQGKLNGVAGQKIFEARGASNITLYGPVLEGVYTTTPTLSEHAIDLISCSDVEIHSPIITNVGGNGIRLDLCNDVDVYDLRTNSTGFLGYIAIDCNRDRLHSAYVQDAADPFSVQSKGGTDSLIDNITVVNPDSCGVIVNTNQDTSTPCIRPRIGKVTVLGDAGKPPSSGTRGGVFMQCQDGFLSEVYMTNNSYIPQVGIGGTTDNLQIGKVTVESNTSIGIDGSTNVGTVIIQSLIAKGNQDRSARFQSGRIHILGGDIRENGIAGTANIEFIDWDYFIISGVTFQRLTTGSTKPNIRLSASSGQGLITGNNFTRNGQPDVVTATNEFRTDCPNVSVHGNENCFVQVTTGWLERFEIKDGRIVESGYSRSNAPTTGTWVQSDTIAAQPSSVGDATKFVCIAAPNTWVSAAVTI